MSRPPFSITFVKPDNARGWIALGCYSFVWAILAMIMYDKSLLDNNAFLVLASALILTGWNQGPVGWAYQATKGGGEAAESSARIAEQAAISAASGPDVQPVIVVNREDAPVPVEPKA